MVSISHSCRNQLLDLPLHRSHARPAHRITAQSKAFTAATFRRPSAEMAELVQTRPHLANSIASLAVRPLLLAGGGLPLNIGGELLGGVGASGGTEEQDVECARAGLAAIGGQ